VKGGQRKTNQPKVPQKTAKETTIRFPVSRAEVQGVQIHTPTLADDLTGSKLEQPDWTHSVLSPVMPTCSSPCNQVQQLIDDVGRLPGQRIIPGGAEIRFSQNISIVGPKATGRMSRNFFREKNTRTTADTLLRLALSFQAAFKYCLFVLRGKN